jgi:hypothetical protein
MVFSSSRDGIHLKFKIKTSGLSVYQCGLFQPNLDPYLNSLDNTFNLKTIAKNVPYLLMN